MAHDLPIQYNGKSSRSIVFKLFTCRIDQDDQIKVGDFGLSEDVYAKNYFRQTSSNGVKLPVKWMALESLKLGVFSEKSDVVSVQIITCVI